jgi:hypothetical protein
MLDQAEGSLYIGEPHTFDIDDTLLGRASGQALYTLVLSANAFIPIRELWGDCFRIYTNQKLNLSTTYGSQVPTGQGMEIADITTAEMMARTFKSRPLCNMEPRTPNEIDGARAVEGVVQYNWDYMKGRQKWYNNIKSTVIYGNGPAVVHMAERMIHTPVTDSKGGYAGFENKLGYRGGWMTNWFIFDFYPDPRFQDIEDDYPKCRVSWNSIDHFIQNSKTREDGQPSLYFPGQVAKIVEFKELPQVVKSAVQNRSFESEQREELGFTNDSRMDQDGIMTVEWEGLFRPTPTSMPVPSIITAANGVCVRVEPTPFWSRENSMIMTRMDWVPGQGYGQGVLQKNMPQLHAANVMFNMALTQAAQAIRGLRMVKLDALYYPQELDNPPGGNLLIKQKFDLDNAVKEVRQAPARNDVINLMGFAMERVRSGSAAKDIKAGASPSGEQTAFETAQISQNIAQRFILPLMNIEDTGIIPASRKIHHLDRQFLDPERFFEILDKDAVYYPQITPAQLVIDPNYICMASKREADTELVLNRLQLGIRNTIPLVGMDASGKYAKIVDELMKQFFEEMQYRNMDKIQAILDTPYVGQEQVEGGQGGQGGPRGQAAPGRSENRQAAPNRFAEMVRSQSGRRAGMR